MYFLISRFYACMHTKVFKEKWDALNLHTFEYKQELGINLTSFLSYNVVPIKVMYRSYCRITQRYRSDTIDHPDGVLNHYHWWSFCCDRIRYVGEMRKKRWSHRLYYILSWTWNAKMRIAEHALSASSHIFNVWKNWISLKKTNRMNKDDLR